VATNLQNPLPNVRRTKINLALTYDELSPLGKKLHDLAQEIELSDEPEFSEADVERELMARRGGSQPDGNEDAHIR
jgi:hypothetical protein